MSVRFLLAALAFACLPFSTLADTTMSRANDPGAPIAGIAALIGVERQALAGLPAEALVPVPPVRMSKPGKTGAPVYDHAWLARQPAASGGAEWSCLTRALYFEARGETVAGQFGVAEVILNRVDSPLYPDSVCAVVGQRGGGGCQFSYICDGRSDTMRDRGAMQVAGRIAAVMLAGAPRPLTEGATHFHTRAVRPGWARRFAHTATIGAHLFYRQPGALTVAAK